MKTKLLVCVIVPFIALAGTKFLRTGVHNWSTRPDKVLLTLAGDDSMEPYIGSRVYFVADRNAYRNNPPQRWDAVVFDEKPQSVASAMWVAGLPGETLELSDGQLLANGVLLELPTRIAPLKGTGWASADSNALNLCSVILNDSFLLVAGSASEEKLGRRFEVVRAARIFGRVDR